MQTLHDARALLFASPSLWADLLTGHAHAEGRQPAPWMWVVRATSASGIDRYEIWNLATGKITHHQDPNAVQEAARRIIQDTGISEARGAIFAMREFLASEKEKEEIEIDISRWVKKMKHGKLGGL